VALVRVLSNPPGPFLYIRVVRGLRFILGIEKVVRIWKVPGKPRGPIIGVLPKARLGITPIPGPVGTDGKCAIWHVYTRAIVTVSCSI
jgi:hypothetical protein